MKFSKSSIIPTALILILAPTFCIIYWAILIFIWPVSRKTFVYLDDKMYSLYQRCIMFFYQYLSRADIIFYGDFHFLKHNYDNVLLISNHQSSADWIVIDILLAQFGRVGRLRHVLKEELRKVPLFGAYLSSHSCVYVDRNNFQESPAVISLQHLIKHNLNSWLVIFPEGTRMNRNNTKVIEKSRNYAESRNFTPLRHHLTPRIRGTRIILENMQGFIKYIVNLTIIYEDTFIDWKDYLLKYEAPGLFDWFKKKRTVHVNIEVIPVSDLPGIEDSILFKWLYEKFELKDRIFDQIFKSQYSSIDKDWPLKYPMKSQLSLSETMPQFLLLFTLTAVLLSVRLGRFMYFCFPTIAAIMGYCISKLTS